jgi:hypothetical protein
MKWNRTDFGDPQGKPPWRDFSENDTNQDMQKPIQQLVCDVHEEINNSQRLMEQNLPFAIKRMVSMLGRVALEHERNHKQLVILTWLIAIFTVVLAVLTVALLFHHG